MEYRKQLVPGVVLLVVSTVYLLLSTQISQFSGSGAAPLSARFIPYLWGTCLLLLSLTLIIRGLRLRGREVKSGAVKSRPISPIALIFSHREVVLTFAFLAVYIALLKPVGFLIMTGVFLVAQTLLLTPREKWAGRYILAVVISSVILAFAIDYIFVVLLNILLPLGLFGF